MPAVAFDDPGPTPKSAPRILPQAYLIQLFKNSVTGVLGTGLAVAGMLIFVIFLFLGISRGLLGFVFVGGGLGGLLFGIGSIMFLLRLRIVFKRNKIYRNGEAVSGKVVSMRSDHSLSAQGLHPWRVDYVYTVQGKSYKSYAHTWHEIVRNGSPLHILYLSAEPEESVVFPPLFTRKP